MTGRTPNAPQPLLIEIGCEEIPARMIARAAADLGSAIAALLDAAQLPRGQVTAWGGSRRIAVRCEHVAARQEDRDETVLGPASRVAFGADGAPTRAGIGFAAKHGVDPACLVEMQTERGAYAGFSRTVVGRSVGEILAHEFEAAVAAMSFPKTMRWGDGAHRWVRPVHWLVALHGSEVLPIALFGVAAGRSTATHRFLGAGPVELAHADDYVATLARGSVVVEADRRRSELDDALGRAAGELGGRLVPDPDLLDEIADLVEWPGVVAGRFDAAFLELPREILVTTLRHHQKAFSVEAEAGRLAPAFLAVANTDRDPAGHVRRGNEWVVSGRLEDARFFWSDDRTRSLDSRGESLSGVAFHARAGSYAEKAGRVARLAEQIARRVGADASRAEHASRLAKNDLVTGLVGEFPELQGIAGALLLRAEGRDEAVAAAIYEHYRPAGPQDALPSTELGAVVAVADKLDTIAALLSAGERVSGSKDPFGLRRAANGIMRIVLERSWPISLGELEGWTVAYAHGDEAAAIGAFLVDRMTAAFRDAGFSSNEIRAVVRSGVDATARDWPLYDIRARLEAIARVRGREDFRKLVQLTERVDSILGKVPEGLRHAVDGPPSSVPDPADAARALAVRVDDAGPRLDQSAARGDYAAAVSYLAEFIDPVERFFVECLVIDPAEPATSASRLRLLDRLRGLLTRYFDIRELAGEAERRS